MNPPSALAPLARDLLHCAESQYQQAGVHAITCSAVETGPYV